MARADLGKGIEMLDLEDARRLDRRRWAAIPKNMGSMAPKDSFAPRVGAVYRLNDKTVLRDRLRAHATTRRPWAHRKRSRRSQYPLALNASFRRPPPHANFGWYGTLDQGIPLLEGPNLSTGRIPLPNTFGMPTLVPEPTHRGPRRIRGTSRSSGACRSSRSNVAYVGQPVGRRPDREPQHQPRAAPGRRRPDRPYFVQRASARRSTCTRRTGDGRTTRCRSASTRPFTKGLLLKGHYTFSRSLALGTSYELPTPEFQAIATGRRRTATAITPPRCRSCTSCRGGAPRIAEHRPADHQRLAAQRHLRRVQRHRRSRSPPTARTLNTPGNTQTADLVGTVTKVGEIGADGVYLRSGRVGAADGVRFGNTHAQPVPRSRRLEPRLLGVPHASRWAARGSSKSGSKPANVTNTPKFANPTSNITSGDFMRIFGLNPSYAERQVRLALRYSF